MLFHREIKPRHVFVSLVVFWVMWVYVAVENYIEREHFRSEVTEFIQPGPRFTAEDGAKLEARIKALEEKEQ